ncbi:MAG: hypothetical protein QM704_12845 [Anaeromyxobacteraceae bacterium]
MASDGWNDGWERRRQRRRERREQQGEALQHRRRGWGEVPGFVSHAGVWAILSFGLHQLPEVAVWWWGFAVAMHGVGILGRVLSRRPPEPAPPLPEPTARREAPPALEPAASPAPADPFLAEVDAAIAALEQAAGARTLPGVDLAALRTTAAELRRRHLALLALGDEAAWERLARERAEALERAQAAADPRTAEVLRAQADSVAGRLAALEQALGAAARLEARERTLLHQVEALRLSLLQTGVDEAAGPDLAAEVERLRLDLRAEAELESDLARARLGARAHQRT